MMLRKSTRLRLRIARAARRVLAAVDIEPDMTDAVEPGATDTAGESDIPSPGGGTTPFPQDVLDGLNSQITAEVYSAYLYLAMSGWCELQNMTGAAALFLKQWHEELAHADDFFQFVNDRMGKISLGQVDAPPNQFADIADVFRQTLAHEVEVTAMIHGLRDTAKQAGDHAADVFLQKYVDEQVEEEDEADRLLAMVERMSAGSPADLELLDKHLGDLAAEES